MGHSAACCMTMLEEDQIHQSALCVQRVMGSMRKKEMISHKQCGQNALDARNGSTCMHCSYKQLSLQNSSKKFTGHYDYLPPLQLLVTSFNSKSTVDICGCCKNCILSMSAVCTISIALFCTSTWPETILHANVMIWLELLCADSGKSSIH